MEVTSGEGGSGSGGVKVRHPQGTWAQLNWWGACHDLYCAWGHIYLKYYFSLRNFCLPRKLQFQILGQQMLLTCAHKYGDVVASYTDSSYSLRDTKT